MAGILSQYNYCISEVTLARSFLLGFSLLLVCCVHAISFPVKGLHSITVGVVDTFDIEQYSTPSFGMSMPLYKDVALSVHVTPKEPLSSNLHIHYMPFYPVELLRIYPYALVGVGGITATHYFDDKVNYFGFTVGGGVHIPLAKRVWLMGEWSVQPTQSYKVSAIRVGIRVLL